MKSQKENCVSELKLCSVLSLDFLTLGDGTNILS